MALVTLPNLGPDPFTVNALVLNGKVDPLATDYNGNIQNVNIASGAGIVYSKLTLTDGILNADINSSAAIVDTKLATLSTAGKVNVTALVVASQAQGDVLYASSATVWSRLGPGTSGQFLKTQGAAANPIWADGVTVASQAEMETATDVAKAVTPGRAQFHPGACKCWVNFNGSGTPAVVAGYNVTSITDNDVGDWTVVIGTDMSSENYCVVVTAMEGGGSQGVEAMLFPTTPLATTGFRISVMTGNGNTRYDSPTVCAAAFGDQ